MLKINTRVSIPDNEIQFSAVRARGPGGQNVNKVASAVHLRFDIKASSLPESYKNRLLLATDSRINKDGIIVIKAQSHRTQDRNREEALERLVEMIGNAVAQGKVRPCTRSKQCNGGNRRFNRGRRRTKRLQRITLYHTAQGKV